MNCFKCKKDFHESNIQESHDVPCYLFIESNKRKERKNSADRFGRHQLCVDCHRRYEDNLNLILKATALKFAKNYFKEVDNGKTYFKSKDSL